MHKKYFKNYSMVKSSQKNITKYNTKLPSEHKLKTFAKQEPKSSLALTFHWQEIFKQFIVGKVIIKYNKKYLLNTKYKTSSLMLNRNAQVMLESVFLCFKEVRI